jgi:hypothetical protein
VERAANAPLDVAMNEDATEFELQQELQRFATQFIDRVTQATEVLGRSPRVEVGDEALRKNLLYVSSAMEIASGPFPEINLLDMIVFVRLSRTVLDRHWIPSLYGQQGNDLAEVFARSERELTDLASRALSAAQRQQLANLADTWLADNPDQVRVEGVRLADFAAAAGSAAAGRAGQARGLLASVKSATRTANHALLLSERGLFLFHRLPFLWRLQARLGAREILNDALVRMTEGPESPAARAKQLVGRGALLLGVIAGSAVLLLWWLGSR